MKRFFSSLLVAILVVGMALTIAPKTSVAADKKYSFTISIDGAEEELTTMYARILASELSKRSSGRISAKVYPNATLGGDRESIESCINGNITFVVQTTAPQVNFIPKLAVFDIPCAFNNISELRKMTDDPLFFRTISSLYDKVGLKAFPYADQGFREMTSNKKVTKLGDFKGIKIRTMENPNHLAFWKAIGANPTPMAFGEVYIGLQQGTIDAQENPYDVIVPSKFYEQQKYLINTNHLPHLMSMIMSKRIYDALSSADKKIIDESVKTARVMIRQKTDERLKERLATIKNAKVNIIDLSTEEMANIRKTSQTVKDKITKSVGKELVDSMYKSIK